jgi:class 3 adenylate cyclase
MGATVRLLADDDYPIGIRPPDREAVTRVISDGWGKVDSAYQLLSVPGTHGDTRSADRAQVARVQRQAASRSDFDRLIDAWFRLDARAYADQVRVPTLVLHRTGDRLVPVTHGRWIADRIENAKLVEIDGDIHFMWLADRAFITGQILDFLHVESGGAAERELAAIVVTDIVESTSQASRVGHEQWRALLDRHDAALRRGMLRFNGVERNTAGDSFVTTFRSAESAVRFALLAVDEARATGLSIRAGVHVGELEERAGTVHGLSIHVATRVQAAAQPGQVLVTTGVQDALVGTAGLAFADDDSHELKGVPGTWRLWRATAG